MCCPKCESSYVENWIVEDETRINTNYNGHDWLNITQGCKCKECKTIWYEHYLGPVTDFYYKIERKI